MGKSRDWRGSGRGGVGAGDGRGEREVKISVREEGTAQDSPI